MNQDQRQHHDLATGEILRDPSAEQPPSGASLAPRLQWQGSRSNLGEAFHLVVTSEAEWQELRERMFAGVDEAAQPTFAPVDFPNEVVLVISSGDGHNCAGISCAAAWEDDARLLVRLQHHTFQSLGEGVPGRAYGMIVLPRRPGKTIVLEHNAQRCIGGPPLWQEQARLSYP